MYSDLLKVIKSGERRKALTGFRATKHAATAIMPTDSVKAESLDGIWRNSSYVKLGPYLMTLLDVTPLMPCLVDVEGDGDDWRDTISNKPQVLWTSARFAGGHKEERADEARNVGHGIHEAAGCDTGAFDCSNCSSEQVIR